MIEQLYEFCPWTQGAASWIWVKFQPGVDFFNPGFNLTFTVKRDFFIKRMEYDGWWVYHSLSLVQCSQVWYIVWQAGPLFFLLVTVKAIYNTQETGFRWCAPTGIHLCCIAPIKFWFKTLLKNFRFKLLTLSPFQKPHYQSFISCLWNEKSGSIQIYC